MSPSSREINGPRPSPLKIHKDSHPIQKQSSSSAVSSSSYAAAQRHQPVIIYTHSPKVIHTQARDFMALVQKLTGLSRSPDDQDGAANPPPPALQPSAQDSGAGKDAGRPHEQTSDAGGFSTLGFVDVPPPALPSPFLSEIPLFTPNSSDFFCSPRNFYRYPEPIAGMGGSISPSLMEVMKAFPEF